MSLVIGMVILGALGMIVIWAPGYPKPPRHEHMRALDELERLYGEPDRYCPTCGAWLAGDALFDRPECQTVWEGA